jgi:photosystem II stability/assembly factor-like uncharacterized protein
MTRLLRDPNPFRTACAALLGAFAVCSAQVEWVPSHGPEGGSIYSMAAKESTLIIGTSSGYPTGGRLYLSHDRGGSWKPSGEGLSAKSSYNLLSASDSSIFLSTDGNGLYRSRDLGKTWKSLSDSLPAGNPVAVLSTGDLLLYPKMGVGAFISRDDGDTWKLSPYLLGGATGLARSGNALYASCDPTNYGVDGLYRSDDEGSTWRETGSFPHQAVTNLVSREDELFACLRDGNVFRSQDSGKTWLAYDTGLPAPLNPVFMARAEESLVLGTEQGVFLRNVGDPQWIRFEGGLPQGRGVWAFAAVGRDFFLGQEMGVYRSPDRGRNWETANSGISAMTIHKLFGAGDILLAATNTTSSVSSDKGRTWRTAKIAGSHFEDAISGMTAIGSRLVAGMTASTGSTAGIYHSADGGETWAKSANADSPTGSPFGKSVFSLVEMSGTLFAGTDRQGLYASPDSGRSWAAVDTALSDQLILSLATDGNKLYAGTPKGVFKSADKGAHWVNASGGLPPTVYYNTVAVSGPNLFTSYCPLCPSGDGYFGLYRSRDEGSSWQPIRKGLSDETQVNTLTAIPGMLFLGTSTGAYVSTDDGDTWTRFGTGSPADNGRQVYVSENTVYATVDGAGVWRADLPEFAYSMGVTTAIHPARGDRQARTRPTLSRQGAAVRYRTANPGMVDLGVYTLEGKRVGTLVHGFRAAGSHVEMPAYPALRGLHLFRLRSPGAGDASALWLD